MRRDVAVLRNGVVVNMVNTSKPLPELLESMEDLMHGDGWVLAELRDVPSHVLTNYRYWNERP